MSEEPKKCPICGNVGEISPYGKARWVSCSNSICSLMLPFDEWQSRPLEDALRAKLHEIEEKEARWEEIGVEGAQLVVVAFGSAARVSLDAVQAARAEGLPVGMIRPITLWPFPKKPFQKIRRSAKAFLDVEMNAGQMQEDLERIIGPDIPVHHLGQGGGKIIYPDEVLEEIKKLMK